MVLTGLWHGASFNFILWGLYFGVILVFEKLFLLEFLKKLPNCIKHFYTMFLVIIGFVLFEIDNLNDVYNYLVSMFNLNNIIVDELFLYYLIPNLALIIFAIIASTPIVKIVLDRYKYIRIIVLIFGMILSTSFLVDASFNIIFIF